MQMLIIPIMTTYHCRLTSTQITPYSTWVYNKTFRMGSGNCVYADGYHDHRSVTHSAHAYWTLLTYITPHSNSVTIFHNREWKLDLFQDQQPPGEMGPSKNSCNY